jgi:hypothetical protein
MRRVLRGAKRRKRRAESSSQGAERKVLRRAKRRRAPSGKLKVEETTDCTDYTDSKLMVITIFLHIAQILSETLRGSRLHSSLSFGLVGRHSTPAKRVAQESV